MPDSGDVIELIANMPNKNLHAGVRGTIVHSHNEDAYEVEFTNETGETLNFLALNSKQFIVVWRADTRQWVPIAQRASALIAKLPDEAAKEVKGVK